MDALILLGLVVALLLVIAAYAHDLYTNFVLIRFVRQAQVRRADQAATDVEDRDLAVIAGARIPRLLS